MLYVRAEFLDSGRFADRAETALASPEVQAYLTDAITAKLVAQGGAEAERAQPLSTPWWAGWSQSDRFEQVFRRAVVALHARLLNEDTAGRVIKLQDAVARAWTRSPW